jgi:hypothetical protein
MNSLSTHRESSTSARCSSGALSVHAPELGSWAVREESRKFWDHVVCDECVYLAKPLDVNAEVAHIFAEQYARNDLWFHIRWTQAEPGLARYRCIEAVLEAIPFTEPFRTFRKADGPIAAVNRDSSVFVKVPEFVELPEMVSLYGIRSVARLKRVESAMDARVEQSSLLPISVVGAADRKDHLVSDLFGGRNRLRKQVDQVPSELIERGAETVKKISNCEGDFFADGLRRDYEKVQRSIGIIFFDNRIRVAFNPVSNLLLGRLEVKVSPSGFHMDVLN